MALSDFESSTSYFCDYMSAKLWKETNGIIRTSDDQQDITGKVAIVTGSNTGIGKMTALELAKRGAIVILAVRNIEKGEEARNDINKIVGESASVDVIQLDLSEKSSVLKFADDFKAKHSQLDILVNNAGFCDNSCVRKESKDGFEMHIAVNHLHTLLLTHLLMDSLRKASPSRVINVASQGIGFAPLDLDDLMMEGKVKTGHSGIDQYAMSKLCNAMCTKKYAEKNGGKDVNFFIVDPGAVQTQMLEQNSKNMSGVMGFVTNKIGGVAMMTPHQSSEGIVFLAVSRGVAEGEGKGLGEAYRFKKPWTKANKFLGDYVVSDKMVRLWEMTENLLQVKL